MGNATERLSLRVCLEKRGDGTEFGLESRLQAVPVRCRLKAGLQTPIFKTRSNSTAVHPRPLPQGAGLKSVAAVGHGCETICVVLRRWLPFWQPKNPL